jgi:hypothetical protein
VRRAAIGRTVDSDRLLQFAKDGNKAIFDDVFPWLKEVFERGLKGNPLRGEEATTWDKELLHREQYDVVQPTYQRYAGADPNMAAELKDLASGADVLTISGVAIANALDFTGDILSAQDRYQHGLNVVVPFYKRFEATVDGSRQRRQQAKPDPSAGGMIKSSEQVRKEEEARRESQKRENEQREKEERARFQRFQTERMEQERRRIEDERRRDQERIRQESERGEREERKGKRSVSRSSDAVKKWKGMGESYWRANAPLPSVSARK